MKYTLTIKDRILFGQILPLKGDLKTMQIKDTIVEKITIKKEESDFIELRAENKDGNIQYKWDREKAKDIEVEFTDEELKVIHSVLSAMEKNKLMTDSVYHFYKIFNNQ